MGSVRVRSGVTFAAALLSAVLAAGQARANNSIEVRNGDIVTSRIDGPADAESFNCTLVANARLTVSAKSRADAGQPPLGLRMRVFDAGGMQVLLGQSKGTGAKAVFTAPSSGTYRVEVAGDGVSRGSFTAKVKWSNPKKLTVEAPLGAMGAAVPFAAQAASTASISVRGSAGTGPGLVSITREAPSSFSLPISAAPGVVSQTGILLPESGDYALNLRNDGADGTATVSFRIASPKAVKRNVDLPSLLGAGAPCIVGGTAGNVDPGGGTVVGPGDSPVIVDFPPGAVDGPTVIIVGSNPDDVDAPLPSLTGVEGTVLIGPCSATFAQPVNVSLPFDPVEYADNLDLLRVYLRDDAGTATLIDPQTYVIDPAGYVTFPTDTLCSFRLFGPRVRGTAELGVSLQGAGYFEGASQSCHQSGGVAYDAGRMVYYGYGGDGHQFRWGADGTRLQQNGYNNYGLQPQNGECFKACGYNAATDLVEVIWNNATASAQQLWSMNRLEMGSSGGYQGTVLNILSPSQASGTMDYANNRIFMHESAAPGEVKVTSRTNGAVIDTITFDLDSAGVSPTDLQRQAVGYDPVEDSLVLVDPTRSNALAFSIEGEFLGATSIAGYFRFISPPGTNILDPGSRGVAYANGLLFLYDASSASWHGVRIFKGSNEP